MEQTTHICKIPCNSMPIVSDANSGLIVKPYVHVNRVADFNVLIYLLKGSMEIIEDGIVYELKPGTLFFLKNHIHHWGVKEFETGTAWYYIHFYTQNITKEMIPTEHRYQYDHQNNINENTTQEYIPLPKIIQLKLGNDLELELEKLIACYQSFVPMKRMHTNIMLWNLLLHCYELGHGKKEEQIEKNRTKKFLLFLEENYNRNFAAEELEAAMGLTYKYIGYLFKKETGMTLKEYQIRLRIKEAVKLLYETELSLTEISDRIGFYDVFYFSKIFKREKGMSPKKFRDTYVPTI